MRTFARALGCLLLMAGATACQPKYDGLGIEPVSTPPTSAKVRPHLFELPVGVAVVISVRPRSSGFEHYDSNTRVELVSLDRNIFDVRRRENEREFVLIGVAPGETCVEVRIDRTPEECIDAVVRAQ
jgi:hypothetical protein